MSAGPRGRAGKSGGKPGRAEGSAARALGLSGLGRRGVCWAGRSLAGVARVGLLAQERRRAGAKAGPLGAAGHWVGLVEFGFGLGLVFLFYSISFLFSISNSNKV